MGRCLSRRAGRVNDSDGGNDLGGVDESDEGAGSGGDNDSDVDPYPGGETGPDGARGRGGSRRTLCEESGVLLRLSGQDRAAQDKAARPDRPERWLQAGATLRRGKAPAAYGVVK